MKKRYICVVRIEDCMEMIYAKTPEKLWEKYAKRFVGGYWDTSDIHRDQFVEVSRGSNDSICFGWVTNEISGREINIDFYSIGRDNDCSVCKRDGWTPPPKK